MKAALPQDHYHDRCRRGRLTHSHIVADVPIPADAELLKQGYVYIAQPPLYKVTRKRRVEYIDDDTQMTRMLLDLGSEDVACEPENDKEVAKKQLSEILELLQSLDKYANAIRRHGGDFTDYLEERNPKKKSLPSHW